MLQQLFARNPAPLALSVAIWCEASSELCNISETFICLPSILTALIAEYYTTSQHIVLHLYTVDDITSQPLLDMISEDPGSDCHQR